MTIDEAALSAASGLVSSGAMPEFFGDGARSLIARHMTALVAEREAEIKRLTATAARQGQALIDAHEPLDAAGIGLSGSLAERVGLLKEWCAEAERDMRAQLKAACEAKAKLSAAEQRVREITKAAVALWVRRPIGAVSIDIGAVIDMMRVVNANTESAELDRLAHEVLSAPATPPQLTVGDIVEAVPPFALRCGSGSYPHAIIVSTNPLVAVSEEGDMLWKATISRENLRRIGWCGAKSVIGLRAFKRWNREQTAPPFKSDTIDCTNTAAPPVTGGPQLPEALVASETPEYAKSTSGTVAEIRAIVAKELVHVRAELAAERTAHEATKQKVSKALQWTVWLFDRSEWKELLSGDHKRKDPLGFWSSWGDPVEIERLAREAWAVLAATAPKETP